MMEQREFAQRLAELKLERQQRNDVVRFLMIMLHGSNEPWAFKAYSRAVQAYAAANMEVKKFCFGQAHAERGETVSGATGTLAANS
jgi:hypothetical protein